MHLTEPENKPMKSIFLVVSSPKVMPTIITSGHWMVPCIKMPFITELYKILSCMMNIMDQSAHFLSTLLLNMTSSTVWFLPPVLIGLLNYGTPTTINKLWELLKTQKTSFMMWNGILQIQVYLLVLTIKDTLTCLIWLKIFNYQLLIKK